MKLSDLQARLISSVGLAPTHLGGLAMRSLKTCSAIIKWVMIMSKENKLSNPAY